MRAIAFSARNRAEILRDPLSLAMGIGFPVVLILMISLLKASLPTMPEELFPMEEFAPGMAVFGLSFVALFLGLLMANDRNSAFLTRLLASPLTGTEYIIGYSLPLLPMAAAQSALCFITALFFGLRCSLNILLAIAVLLPAAVLFIGLGLIIGSLLSPGQVGGAGSILINLAAWLSGVWFDLDMMGGVFRKICYALPFAHALDAAEAAISGVYTDILPHLAWVTAYAAVIYAAAVVIFRKKTRQ